jgi:hypothetical protein
MGGCTSLHAQPHNLLITLRHPPSILSVPYPIPGHLLSAPGSHFPPPPLDGDGEDQVECDIWDMLKAKDWMDFRGTSLFGNDCADGQIILLYRRRYQFRRPLESRRFSPYRRKMDESMQCTRALKFRISERTYVTTSCKLNSAEGQETRGTPKGISSPLPAHQAASSSISLSTQVPKYTGQLLYPAPPRPKDTSSGMEALGLLERRGSRTVSGEKEELDPAVHVTVNPRFGLVAVGTQGCVSLYLRHVN